MLGDKGTGRVTSRAALVRAVLFDVQLVPITMIVWAYLGLLDPLIAAPLWGLRLAGYCIFWQVETRPLRRWELAEGSLEDAELAAADACAQRLVGRFTRVYGASLVGIYLLAAASSWAGVHEEYPFGDAELISLSLFALAMIAPAAMLRALLDWSLSETEAALWAELRERRSEGPRRRSSAFLPVVEVGVWVLFSCLTGMYGLSYHFYVQGLREAAVNVQLREAEVTALEHDLGQAHRFGEVELVDPAGVEPWLGEALEALGPGELLSGHDPRQGLAYAAAPLADGRWALARGEPEEQRLPFLVLLFVTISLALPMIRFGFRFSARRIAEPMRRFSEAAKRFSVDGDLSSFERVVPARNDELGELALNFGAMIDTLEELASVAGVVAEGDLSVEIVHGGQLHQAFAALLVRLRETVGQLRETSLEVAVAANEVDGLTREQDGVARRQSVHVGELRGALASLAGSAESIADATRGVLANAEQTVSTTDELSDKIASLRAEATSIEALLAEIQEIAERSDLLALNGSLEAVRAGDAGRGFALVASEMRRLAERVSGTVSDVRGRVDSIGAAGAQSVEATENSRGLAQLTASAARSIAAETTRQSGDSTRVSTSVDELGKMVEESNEVVARSRSAASGLRDYAARLERLTAGFVLADEAGTHAGLASTRSIVDP